MEKLDFEKSFKYIFLDSSYEAKFLCMLQHSDLEYKYVFEIITDCPVVLIADISGHTHDGGRIINYEEGEKL